MKYLFFALFSLTAFADCDPNAPALDREICKSKTLKEIDEGYKKTRDEVYKKFRDGVEPKTPEQKPEEKKAP